MAYYIVSVPYNGVARIPFDSEKEPDRNAISAALQSKNFDGGIPQYQIQKKDIEIVKENEFRTTQNKMEKKALSDLIRTTAMRFKDAQPE